MQNKFALFIALMVLEGSAYAGSSTPDKYCLSLLKNKVKGVKVETATFQPKGLIVNLGREGMSPVLPEHCEIKGILEERTGAHGQSYAIRFHLRLPTEWNKKFFFEGGGGTNGNLGSAVGKNGSGNAPALTMGYAIISQDSGHSNALNSKPEDGGDVAFGFDPKARQNYGHRSLKLTSDAALALIKKYYGKKPKWSYFYGCSKGGQEGMAFAQKYPEVFDGIIAIAPGFSLPKAAIAEAWDTQTFGAIAPKGSSFTTLAHSFSNEDLKMAQKSILAACDGDDGIVDGIIGAFKQCTTVKVLPKLKAHQCQGDQTENCLSEPQITALVKSFGGAKNSKGEQLYSSFPWDAGLSSMGWRRWKIGIENQMPAMNVLMGSPSLAAVFSTPPRAISSDPQDKYNYLMSYDFDVDAEKIFASNEEFPRSGWDDISARSPNITKFIEKGGKMIVPHGVSDPVFSINDTINWWEEVNKLSKGKAAKTVRVFPVPGMNHCGGGPATDHYDALSALVNWVENSDVPDQIIASGSTLDGGKRSRPLCPYPQIAKYNGTGDKGKAINFTCEIMP